MLMYSDESMDKKLSFNVRDMSGIISKGTKKVILMCSEGTN